MEIWYEEIYSGNWSSPNQLKRYYGGAVSVLKNGRAVFNIKANDYRLIAAINYENNWVFIKFIGTHAAYDTIDANTVDVYRPKNKTRTNNKKANENRNNKK